MSETAAHDHEFEVLEDDQTVPPRPEEEIADASASADAPEAAAAAPGDSAVAPSA
jgi:hypothetical protein